MKKSINIVWFFVVIFSCFIFTACPDPNSTTNSGNTDPGGNPGGNPNNAPVVSLTANPAIVPVSDSSTITCNATDSDNDPLTYTWTASGGTITGYSNAGATAFWVAPATIGASIITCKVSDSKIETLAQINIAIQEWVIPTQFASSLSACDRVVDGANFNGKLYLVWMKSNNICTSYDVSYLSIFNSNTFSSSEVLRINIVGIDGVQIEGVLASDVEVDQDGIYLAITDYNAQITFLTKLDFNANRIWLSAPSDINQIGVYGRIDMIKVQSGYIYITGQIGGQVPGFINAGYDDIFVGKYTTADGSQIWLSQWGTTGIDMTGYNGRRISVELDGIYVPIDAGFTSILDPNTPTPAYIRETTLKYDFNGNLLSVTQP